jgi:hypothetical protein
MGRSVRCRGDRRIVRHHLEHGHRRRGDVCTGPSAASAASAATASAASAAASTATAASSTAASSGASATTASGATASATAAAQTCQVPTSCPALGCWSRGSCGRSSRSTGGSEDSSTGKGRRQARPSSHPLADVNRALEQLQPAKVVFNVPNSLHLGSVAEIQLVLSPTRSIRELSQHVTAIGKKQGATIKVSPLMEAHLTGLGFKIETISPVRQPVSSDQITKWAWDIQPTETGTKHLHLTLDAFITVDGRGTLWSVRTFDRTLRIRITWFDHVSGFVSGNWQWMWTAIFLPIAGLAFRRLKKRQNL